MLFTDTQLSLMKQGTAVSVNSTWCHSNSTFLPSFPGTQDNIPIPNSLPSFSGTQKDIPIPHFHPTFPGPHETFQIHISSPHSQVLWAIPHHSSAAALNTQLLGCRAWTGSRHSIWDIWLPMVKVREPSPCHWKHQSTEVRSLDPG